MANREIKEVFAAIDNMKEKGIRWFTFETLYYDTDKAIKDAGHRIVYGPTYLVTIVIRGIL